MVTLTEEKKIAILMAMADLRMVTRTPKHTLIPMDIRTEEMLICKASLKRILDLKSHIDQ